MENTAILLTNLGSPDSPSVGDVRRYLNQFLMDERVIDLPYLFRLMLVRGIIVPFRAPKSAHKYQTIWTEQGSPLVSITKDVVSLVEKKTMIPTYMSMRYGNPTPKAALDEIQNRHPKITRLIVVPLYPHYAMSSYETAVEHIKETHQQATYSFALQFVPAFFNHPSYIKALSESIQPYVAGDYGHLLFSYHGIPERHVKKTDPTACHCLKVNACCDVPSDAHAYCYRHQVRETTRLTAERLQLSPNQYSISFQSRLGQDKWLSPSTVSVLESFPKKGIKKLVVVCPAFVSDCLETLEEIHEEGKEIFLKSGGTSYTVIPCLNTNSSWIDTIDQLLKEVG